MLAQCAVAVFWMSPSLEWLIAAYKCLPCACVLHHKQPSLWPSVAVQCEVCVYGLRNVGYSLGVLVCIYCNVSI